jgi:hypothetical protein
MIHRKFLMASVIIASAAITACADTTAPKELIPGGLSSKSSPRSGALLVTKNCSEYFGQAGEFCTITSSNIKQIKAGSRVVYASPAGAASLESDLVLDPPGPGNNRAFGHVVLDFATSSGVVTFSGGTGKFKSFRARVAVSYLGGRDWAWDGTYSFRDRDRDDDNDRDDDD